jgi:hypothetical protein
VNEASLIGLLEATVSFGALLYLAALGEMITEKAGILSELKRREYYDKPSIRKKKKAAAARKRALKKMRRAPR